MICDNFAGGGGASTGIEQALGRAVDLAINHDEDAIRMHEANHPGTLHLRNNIWQVDPLDATGGRQVDLAWFSPDCKHFSKAKGGKPREKSIRDLAWVVVHWVQRLQEHARRMGNPDWRQIIKLILIENVEEFRTWGPLCDEGKPIKERSGETFDLWTAALKKCGGKIEFRELRACDYGAPTIRKRLFIVIRFDGQPICWPAPTHGKPGSPEVLSGKLKPWRTAADIIDWSLPCPSIFERDKPLAEKTLRRIAHGIMKFVVNNPSPFIVPGSNVAPIITYAQQGDANRSAQDPLHTVCASRKDQNCIAAAHLVHVGNGERAGQLPRAMDIEKPLGTVVAGGVKQHAVMAFMQKFSENGKGVDPREPLHTVMAGAPRHALVCAHIEQANGGPNNEALAGRAADAPLSTIATSGSQQRLVTSNLIKLRGTSDGHVENSGAAVDAPLNTISAGGIHTAEVRAFLIKYYGNEQDGHGLGNPLGTVTVNDRFGLVTVSINGEDYIIVDIGMRMLTPRELFNAQGFPPDYIIDRDAEGRAMTKTSQVARCGNSVCPPLARALVEANVVAAQDQVLAA